MPTVTTERKDTTRDFVAEWLRNLFIDEVHRHLRPYRVRRGDQVRADAYTSAPWDEHRTRVPMVRLGFRVYAFPCPAKKMGYTWIAGSAVAYGADTAPGDLRKMVEWETRDSARRIAKLLVRVARKREAHGLDPFPDWRKL